LFVLSLGYITKVGLKLKILLPQLLECGDYRQLPPFPVEALKIFIESNYLLSISFCEINLEYLKYILLNSSSLSLLKAGVFLKITAYMHLLVCGIESLLHMCAAGLSSPLFFCCLPSPY
jgi:hypothetical protein